MDSKAFMDLSEFEENKRASSARSVVIQAKNGNGSADRDYKPGVIKADISPVGITYVQTDPNLTDETMKALLRSDMDKLSFDQIQEVSCTTKKELIQKTFYDNNDTGFVHLAQCIQDDLSQDMATLVATFSSEKNIPFLLGAIYIKAMIEDQKTLYYIKRTEKGYVEVPWLPKKTVGVMKQVKAVTPLPKKAHRRKKPIQTA